MYVKTSLTCNRFSETEASFTYITPMLKKEVKQALTPINSPKTKNNFSAVRMWPVIVYVAKTSKLTMDKAQR